MFVFPYFLFVDHSLETSQSQTQKQRPQYNNDGVDKILFPTNKIPYNLEPNEEQNILAA